MFEFSRPAVALVAVLVPVAGCVAGRGRVDYGDFVADRSVASIAHQRRSLSVEQRAVQREARLEVIERIVLERNPDLGEEQSRIRASLERVSASGRLPDLELKYEQWGVPLVRPYDLGSADTVMIGLRQTIPAPGTRGAASRVAFEDAAIGRATLHTRELDLLLQVRRAYFEYVLAEREYALHLEHAELTKRLSELARAGYGAGRGNQQDVLRITVELSRLHNDLVAIGQRKRSSVALLNTLMGREPDAPLGPPAAL
ncbi:MAG TPA: TolC family protein, partial [Planctomycetota bacterium]|nr:TolC family protein [Planctomycetota bacterium]